MVDFPPGGVLFANNRKSNPKAPDINGKLEIDRATLEYLVECRDRGGKLEMALAGWRRQMKTGGEYFSLKAQPPRNLAESILHEKVKERKKPTDDMLNRLPESNMDDEIPF